MHSFYLMVEILPPRKASKHPLTTSSEQGSSVFCDSPVSDGKLWITKTCLRAAAPGLAEWWRQGTMTLPTVPRHCAHLLPPQPMLLHDCTVREGRTGPSISSSASDRITHFTCCALGWRAKFQHAWMTFISKYGEEKHCMGFERLLFISLWQEQRALWFTEQLVCFNYRITDVSPATCPLFLKHPLTGACKGVWKCVLTSLASPPQGRWR